MLHSRELKKKICENICINYFSTLKTANEYNMTKDEPVLNDDTVNYQSYDINYDDLNKDELKNIIMKKDIEIVRLKKAYTVKGGGTEKRYSLLSPKRI